MQIIENKNTVLELIKAQKDFLVDNPSIEMELTIKNLSSNCIKELAKHYNPVFPADETINPPVEIAPYYWFAHRINEILFVTFRTPSLNSSIKFN